MKKLLLVLSLLSACTFTQVHVRHDCSSLHTVEGVDYGITVGAMIATWPINRYTESQPVRIISTSAILGGIVLINELRISAKKECHR
jgi:hypothetical protein